MTTVDNWIISGGPSGQELYFNKYLVLKWCTRKNAKFMSFSFSVFLQKYIEDMWMSSCQTDETHSLVGNMLARPNKPHSLKLSSFWSFCAKNECFFSGWMRFYATLRNVLKWPQFLPHVYIFIFLYAYWSFYRSWI